MEKRPDNRSYLAVVGKPVLCGGLVVDYLRRQPWLAGLDVIVCADLGQLQAQTQEHQAPPDVVLLLDCYSGDEVYRHQLKAMKESFPDADILVLGYSIPEDESAYLAQVGVRGWVCLADSPEQLTAAVQLVLSHQTVVLPRGRTTAALETQHLLHRFGMIAQQNGESLTNREKLILGWLMAGLRDREIADKVGVSSRTVQGHVHHILEKTRYPSRARLLAARTAH